MAILSNRPFHSWQEQQKQKKKIIWSYSGDCRAYEQCPSNLSSFIRAQFVPRTIWVLLLNRVNNRHEGHQRISVEQRGTMIKKRKDNISGGNIHYLSPGILVIPRKRYALSFGHEKINATDRCFYLLARGRFDLRR